MKNEPHGILTFPMIFIENLQEDLLPKSEKEQVQELQRQHSHRAEAEAAFREIKNLVQDKTPPKTTAQGSTVEWFEPHDTFKTTIRNHPPTAVKTYLTWPQGWTRAEITEIACQDPESSYWLANKDPQCDIARLQQAAGNKPEIAYEFARTIKGAQIHIAIQQTACHAYWYHLTLSIDQPKIAQELLRHRIPYDPNAALAWITTQPVNEKEMQICQRVLKQAPEQAYRAAKYIASAHKTTLLDSNHPIQTLWTALRMSNHDNPRWIYHWLRDLAPSELPERLHELALHPGWAAQTIVDLRPKFPPKEFTEHAKTLEKYIHEVHDDKDPWSDCWRLWSASYFSERCESLHTNNGHA